MAELVLQNIYDDVEALKEQMLAVQSMVEDSGWINLTLNTGWSMNNYPNEVPQYRKIGKLVMLRGLVNGTASADRVIATLPVGYRPARGYFNRFNNVLNQSDYINVQLNANGQIMDYTKDTNTGRAYLSLNGIEFYTA